MQNLLLCLAVLMAGCAQTPQKFSTSAGSDADAGFEKLANDYIAGYLAWRPQTGTALGMHQYDGKVTEFSRESLDKELARLKAFEQQLTALQMEKMTSHTAHDFALLRSAVQRELFGFEQMKVHSQNPMTYAGVLDVNIYIKRNFAPLEQRVKSIITVLQQATSIMAAGRANLSDSLPRPQIELAMEEADGSADFLGKDLVDALKEVKDEQLMATFNLANQNAIRELRGYVSYLKDEKLPKANQNYALGREKYMQLLRYGEMITLSPEELLKIGMTELRRKQQAFAESAGVINREKTPIEVFKATQKEHPTAESLIPDTARDLESIRQFVVEHHLVTIPSPVRAKVQETPQFMRATSFASMDTPGPFETKATEAYYYVTPVEPEWSPQQKEEWLTAFNYYTTDIVSVHEVYPGHYVQFLCLNASQANRLEKIFTSYAFTEGWAHYAEQMMVDEGFGTSATGAVSSPEQTVRAAKYRLAQIDEALLRVCRFCVSIKMHCQGMTVDEATRFFVDNCYYAEKPARQEAMRGTFDPEYLYYTLGKLEILKLREDYRKQEGARFSLEKFHNEMLRHGAPPIRLLRQMLLKEQASWEKVL